MSHAGDAIAPAVNQNGLHRKAHQRLRVDSASLPRQFALAMALAAAVLTGITPKEQFESEPLRPAYILPGLPELLEAFRAADR